MPVEPSVEPHCDQCGIAVDCEGCGDCKGCNWCNDCNECGNCKGCDCEEKRESERMDALTEEQAVAEIMEVLFKAAGV